MPDNFKEGVPLKESANARVLQLKAALYEEEERNGGYQALWKVGDAEFVFAHRLQDRHPDFRMYGVYHVLVGGTVPDDAYDKDFEGEDSVEAFYRSLPDKLRSEQKPK